MKRNLTKAEVYDIWNYCIGGYGVPYETKETEVYKFLEKYKLNAKSILKESIQEQKQEEQRELQLEGYYDY